MSSLLAIRGFESSHSSAKVALRRFLPSAPSGTLFATALLSLFVGTGGLRKAWHSCLWPIFRHAALPEVAAGALFWGGIFHNPTGRLPQAYLSPVRTGKGKHSVREGHVFLHRAV